LALARTGGAIPEIEYRGALWFAAVAYATVWPSW
jgi:hypothetical protein